MLTGHARIEITPGTDCPLIGYDQREELFPEGGNAGINDPLFADALVLESDAARAVILTLDLCVLETSLADALRKVVGASAGCPPEAVFIACSHTHSGPYPCRTAIGGAEPLPGILRNAASQAYADALEKILERVADMAARNLSPSALRQRSSTFGMGYTRRVRLDDGSIGMAWNLREWDGPEPEPAGDQAFEVLIIERENAPSILLWNTAAHPVVLGKQSNVVSADWPGAARAAMESAMPNFRSMFLHGAGADVHPWLATGADPADLDSVAAPVASLCALLASPPGLNINSCQLNCESEGSLSALRIGSVKLLACPFEMFGITGAALRSRFPGLLIATTTNGWSGYCAPSEVFEEGGYEAEAAHAAGWKPGDCEAILDCAVRLLARV